MVLVIDLFLLRQSWFLLIKMYVSMSKRMEAIFISSYKDILIIFNIPILFDGIIVISDKATFLDDEAFFVIVKK
jgi:hypothetical protein